ncbi:MAG TPA: anthranilate synthase component I, partial [Candidatus Acidoferrum sp.]|nr:anthranilate synthase component I [Candidatus Acidoferrum sp.]
ARYHPIAGLFVSGEDVDIFEALQKPAPQTRSELELEEMDLPGDLETPVSAYLKLRSIGARFLLESAEDSKSIGRYTFLGVDPLLRIEIRDDDTFISAGAHHLSVPHSAGGAPFDGLRRVLDRFRLSSRTEIPLLGGLVGYASYDIVKFFEPSLRSALAPEDGPIGLFYFVDTLLVFDHYMRRMKLVRLRHKGEPLHNGTSPIPLEKIASTLSNQLPTIPQTKATAASSNGYKPNFSQVEYEAMVETTREHIVKGDVFQTVISLREEHQTNVDSFLVYRALRMINPSPYMYFLDFDDVQLFGSSPEVLVTLHDRRARVRPIAGTRRRGQNPESDRRMAQELIHDAKERAEHVMLVDLARNDLGRVCEFGSISVPSMFDLEYFSHVMHLTSTVTGKLKEGLDSFDLFRSTFPAGTVSGAPKLRAMEIIAELERSSRGTYAGAVGYFSLSGDFDMCITIRTIVRQNGSLRLQAGAGIVADSIPSQEYLETRNKIAALKQAIANAEEGRL